MRNAWIFAFSAVLWLTSAVAESGCEDKTPPACINNFFNQTGCSYSFANATCMDLTQSTDLCQTIADQLQCDNTGCFWDSFLSTCLASLSQVNSVIPCSYWTGYTLNNGLTNPACPYHGCKYDPVVKRCINFNETLAASPPPSTYSTLVRFINASVDTENQLFHVTAAVPFAYTEATPTRPKFPLFQVLFPVNNIQFYSTQEVPLCSTYSPLSPHPVPFTTVEDPQRVNQMLVDWTREHHNFEFNSSYALLSQILGYTRIGGNQTFVKSVSFDGSRLLYAMTFELLHVTVDCSQRGAQYSNNVNGRVYTLPISYVELSPNSFYTQVVQTYSITIPTTGTVVLGTSTNYGTGAFPVGVVFERGQSAGCTDNEGRIRVSYQVETYNVYDPLIRVGVMTREDVSFRSPASPAGPVNCYGDQLAPDEAAFTTVICDYSSYVCRQTLTLRSKCRSLTSDGEAFNQCSYAKAADRIGDMGSDIPYNVALDGLHQFFVYRRVCPLTEGDLGSCPTFSSNPNGYPDPISAVILGSSYLDETQNGNSFLVSAGFLPSATADLSQSVSGTLSANATLRVREDELITVFVSMQAGTRDRYDLRIHLDDANTRIVPLSASGVPLGQTAGYTGRLRLSYSDFRPYLQYASKNDFDAGCGVTGQCRILPACSSVLGCDGFSLPAAQLRAVMPADRYLIGFSFRASLPEATATPAGRRLLQTSSGSSGFDGQAGFQFEILFNATSTNQTNSSSSSSSTGMNMQPSSSTGVHANNTNQTVSSTGSVASCVCPLCEQEPTHDPTPAVLSGNLSAVLGAVAIWALLSQLSFYLS